MMRPTAPPPSSTATSTLRASPIPTIYVPRSLRPATSASKSERPRETTLVNASKECDSDTFYEPKDDVARVLALGLLLSLVHGIGIVVAARNAYLRLTEPQLPDTPSQRVCTTPLFCLWFTLVSGICGVALQVAGSIIELVLSLLLIWGVCTRQPWMLTSWLIYHVFVVLGCVALTGVFLSALIIRQSVDQDLHWTTLIYLLLPIALAILFALCWLIVLDAMLRMRRHNNNVFQCVV